MKLVAYSRGADQRVGFLLGEQVCDLRYAAESVSVSLPEFEGLIELATVDNLPVLSEVLQKLNGSSASEWSYALGDVTLHAPFRPKQNFIIAGGNTPDDFVAQRSKNGKPLLRYHTKAPSAVIGPGEAISWPRRLSSQIHAEPHLAVVIGKSASYQSGEDALSCIFGYAVATNINGYDLKCKHGQWDKAVSLDTFCPWGPVIVTADEVDLNDLTCRLWLNDRMALSGGVETGLLTTAELISELSFGITLEPGDVVLTATAEGVGFGVIPERWLQDGDVVRSGIEGIGEIENSVVTYV